MLSTVRRLAACFSLFLAPLAPALAGAPAPAAVAPAAPAAAQAAEVPWLYKGSDVPVDRSWTFGTLSNGLRYAVKRNGVPPGQVSIRVRVDAGALNEEEQERGFAHLIEHLTFRGSTYVPEGEAKRIWQRFGATFGSDSNAQTTPTQTVYKLDLPSATPASLDESFKILSGMIRDPLITPRTVDAERAVVLAEMREGSGPPQTVGDAMRALMFAGQRLADRSPIGTVATLTAATPQGLRAFHDRWYRPGDVVIVAAGDIDPATLEKLIGQYFGDWTAKGPPVPAPDFGRPSAAAGPEVKEVIDPTLPTTLTLATLRPWRKKDDTIVYNQQLLIDALALQMINRRLEARARNGGSYLEASVAQDDISRSADTTFVQIVPVGDDWQAALRDVRAVIADATSRPPSQADIDRELASFGNSFKIGVDSYPFEAAAKQADDIVNAVDIRETVATPMVAQQVFASTKPLFTPERLLASTRKLFEGPVTRLLLSGPKPIAGGERALAASLHAPVTPAGDVRLAAGSTGPDALPSLGPPGKLAASERLPKWEMEKLRFANGVTALLYPNAAENGKVKLLVRFGRGRQAVAPGQEGALWAGPLALVQSGVGKLGAQQLDELANGRRLGMNFSVDDDAFEFSGDTSPADLALNLKLIAAKLAHPRWDAAPVERAKAVVASGYRSYETSASSVLDRDLQWLLHGRDNRWKTPTPQEAAQLTPAAFKAFWGPMLASGPIEVMLFGDFKRDDAVKALAESFGALPARVPAPIAPGADRTQLPAGNINAPLKLTHRGPADQAEAVVAWPTGAGLDDIVTKRRLEVLAEIFKDRLFEKFRSEEAQSYSPYVLASWPDAMTGGGSFVALAQVQPANVERFIARAQDIAADLAANPVSADELARQVEPIKQLIARASTGNAFWLSQLQGATRDPRRFDVLGHMLNDYTEVTPAELQQLAKTYLRPDRAFVVEVLPAAR